MFLSDQISDLSSVIFDARNNSIADKKQIAFKYIFTTIGEVIGEPEILKSVFSRVFKDILKYASNYSHVSVSTSDENSSVILVTIKENSLGLTKENLDRSVIGDLARIGGNILISSDNRFGTLVHIRLLRPTR